MGHRKGGPKPTDPLALFHAKTRPAANGCIEWIAGRSPDGYGKFATGPHGSQQHHRAHRWIYEQTHGPIGALVLRHRCDNPICVNVEHLEPGTQLDNIHDARSRGRLPVVLNADLVRHLRGVRARGESVRAEANRLGIRYPTAINAAKGITWRHVE